jgi:hypothetical protein
VPGTAQGWYHEKESACLYQAVAAAAPDPSRRARFLKLAVAVEDQAACWRRADPAIPGHFSPALAREELGLNPDDLGSPVRAALPSFLLLSLFTGHGAPRGGLRLMCIGAGAGIAAWAAGRLPGAGLA